MFGECTFKCFFSKGCFRLNKLPFLNLFTIPNNRSENVPVECNTDFVSQDTLIMYAPHVFLIKWWEGGMRIKLRYDNMMKICPPTQPLCLCPLHSSFHPSECSVGGMPPNATFPTEDKKRCACVK